MTNKSVFCIRPAVMIDISWMKPKTAKKVRPLLLFIFWMLKLLICVSLNYEIVIGVRILPEDHSAFSIMTLVLYILAAVYFLSFQFVVKGNNDESGTD